MTIFSIGKLSKLNEPVYLSEILMLNVNALIRRNRLYLPKFDRNHYQNSFCYQAPKFWNLLASSPSYCYDVTNSPTLTSMKSRLKKFLIIMQTYGSKTEWIDSNKAIGTYLTAIKADPNFDKVGN